MLALALLFEIVVWCATISVMAWLRHWQGERLGPYQLGARYTLPLCGALFFALALIIAIKWAVTGQEPGLIAPTIWVVIGGVIAVALVTLTAVKARRYRARPPTVRRVDRPRPRLW